MESSEWNCTSGFICAVRRFSLYRSLSLFFVELDLMSQAIKVYDDLGCGNEYCHTQT